MSDSGTLRNRAKIEATLVIAMELVKIKEEFGSFRNFLDNLDKSENYKYVKKELAK